MLTTVVGVFLLGVGYALGYFIAYRKFLDL